MKPNTPYSEITSLLEENKTLKRKIEEIKAKADEHSQLSQQLQSERDRAHAKVARMTKQITKLASNLASASTARLQSAAETRKAILALNRSLSLNQLPNEMEPQFELSDAESSGDDTDTDGGE